MMLAAACPAIEQFAFLIVRNLSILNTEMIIIRSHQLSSVLKLNIPLEIITWLVPILMYVPDEHYCYFDGGSKHCWYPEDKFPVGDMWGSGGTKPFNECGQKCTRVCDRNKQC